MLHDVDIYMATKAQEPKKTEPTNERIDNGVTYEIVKPQISPELATTMLTANFDYIRKNFGIGKWSKCKTPEEKKKFLMNYKKLIDSMNAMGEYLWAKNPLFSHAQNVEVKPSKYMTQIKETTSVYAAKSANYQLQEYTKT